MILGIHILSGLPTVIWVNLSRTGIWFGLWIVVTGIIGVFSARQPHGGTLNAVNIGFNIACTVLSVLSGVFFLIAVM